MLPDLSGRPWDEAREVLRAHGFEGERVQVLDITPTGEVESRLHRSSQTPFAWGHERVVRLQVLEESVVVTVAREMMREEGTSTST